MRTVLVGASSGSGRAIGSGLGQRGAQVALLARRKDRLVDAAKEAGEGSLAVACDVTDEESVKAAVEDAAAQLGGIDALVFVDVEDLTHVVHTVITNGAAIKPVVVDARRTVPLPLNIPAQTS
ncbi:SDR family NAD(P)-dependent oxidoreductase [Pseudofrankia sp. DC12]|uniref:SDR family oxidoreductase n=1 Tax=Pseudofrankia sp. DC12 TaxID=683315 RepID=UPI0005F80437|nr:SDR family NAD(P)-dependent oxidoreductase [Pseudofrankia sp. DC12]